MRTIALALVSSLFAAACIGDAPAPSSTGGGSGSDTGITGGGNGSGSSGDTGGDGGGRGSGNGGTGSGSAGGGSDAGVPAPVTIAPDVSVSQSCGDAVTPLTAVAAITGNGCNIAANTVSGCPAQVPAGKSLDGIYRACHIGATDSDCTLGSAYVECPFGESAGPLSVNGGPPAGQAGYGYVVALTRTAASGSIVLQWDAYEVGVRADGTIAWQGPDTSGTSVTAADSCCAQQFLVSLPGSGEAEKVAIDQQWF